MASIRSTSTAPSTRISRASTKTTVLGCRAAVERSIATGRAAQEEYRIVRPDGEIRSVYTRAEPTIDSAGEVVGLRGVGQDITEDRRVA